jgi:S-adenosylmethionine:tRNA ribosyltransferase-isomerase
VSGKISENTLKTADFDFDLPPGLVAQHPSPIRDASRLLATERASGQRTHHHFADLPQFLHAGDVLVLNNSRVIPARLHGRKIAGKAIVEILLIEPAQHSTWWAMVRPGKRLQPGTSIALYDRTGQPTSLVSEVIEKNKEGHARLRFDGTEDVLAELHRLGEMPLPPYIQREAHGQTKKDIDRYQTVYADPAGSIAAPTAGLHFTETLLDQLRSQGVEIHALTLHVGLGTFAPVKVDSLDEHHMHIEHYTLPPETTAAINAAKAEGRRVIAVGTTTVRVLESAALTHKPLAATNGSTDIFIYPPHKFRIVDALITNFHVPQSTLLMLVSAFAAPDELRGREWILETYAEAIREKYRFFSYGDAMLIT